MRERLRDADAAALAGQPRAALQHYRDALEAEPRLSGDASFVDRLRQAQAASAMLDAERHARQGAWTEAIGAYTAALDAAPGRAAAQAGLAHARREASRQAHRQALQLADQNRLAESLERLRTAVALDDSNQEAHAALDGALQRQVERRAQAAQRHAEGLDLERQLRWRAAAGAHEQALALDPDHHGARVALHRVNEQVQRVGAAREAGARWLEQFELDLAIASLEEALAQCPSDEHAARLLETARSSKAEVHRHQDLAQAAASAGDWDRALAACERAGHLDPSNGTTRRLLEQVRRDAAAALTSQGDQRLATGSLDEASSWFGAALRFRPDHAPARTGMAQVQLEHGRSAASAGAWGQALLAAMRAARFQPALAGLGEALDTARQHLGQRVAFGVALLSAAGPDAADLEDAVRALAATELPRFMSLTAGPGSADYIARLDSIAGEVRHEVAASERRVHTYTVHETVPNPILADLEQQLHDAERRRAHLCHAVERKCRACDGAGTVPCTSCRGHGDHACDRCRGTGRHGEKEAWRTCPACLGHSRVPHRCRACGGDGQIEVAVEEGRSKRRVKQVCRQCSGPAVLPMCPTCGGSGRVPVDDQPRDCEHCRGRGDRQCARCHGQRRVRCDHCAGSGHDRSEVIRKLHRADEQLAELRHRLAVEPMVVQRAVLASVPYEVQHHRLLGVLRGRLTITETASSRTIAALPVEQRFDAQDTTTDRCDPAVGLEEDALDLPDAAQVHRDLALGAAARVVAALRDTILRARIAHRLAEAQAHAGAGRSDAALEARVDAAVLLEPLDAAESDRQLRALPWRRSPQPGD